ncbi:hypothetical protein F4604DRAFT_1794850 [Suillus subluteus]|nr:hypothetical protein F4604DRAFT_1794850 [Suillus subluteus]
MQRMKLLWSFLYSSGSFLHSSRSPLALNQSSQPPEVLRTYFIRFHPDFILKLRVHTWVRGTAHELRLSPSDPLTLELWS